MAHVSPNGYSSLAAMSDAFLTQWLLQTPSPPLVDEATLNSHLGLYSEVDEDVDMDLSSPSPSEEDSMHAAAKSLTSLRACDSTSAPASPVSPRYVAIRPRPSTLPIAPASPSKPIVVYQPPDFVKKLFSCVHLL